MGENMRILLRLPNWVGDVVMSIGCVRVLAQHFPNAEIELIAQKHLAELATYFPGVSRVHAFDKEGHKSLKKLYQYGKQCSAGRLFTHYITLPLSFSSAWMGYATRAKVRVGYSADARSFLLTHAYKMPPNTHRVEAYAYLVQRYFRLQKVELDTSLKLPPAALPLLPAAPLRIVLSFVANNTARTLPVHLAHAYIDKLASKYPEAHFFLIAAESHHAYNAEIIAGRPSLQPRLHNLAGKTTLLQLGQLLAEVDILIATESGPNHLANSVGCPLLVLVGAGDEHKTGPYMRQRRQLLRAPDIPCAPCFRETCRWAEPRCLLAIRTEEVIAAVDTLLHRQLV